MTKRVVQANVWCETCNRTVAECGDATYVHESDSRYCVLRYRALIQEAQRIGDLRREIEQLGAAPDAK